MTSIVSRIFNTCMPSEDYRESGKKNSVDFTQKQAVAESDCKESSNNLNTTTTCYKTANKIETDATVLNTHNSYNAYTKSNSRSTPVPIFTPKIPTRQSKVNRPVWTKSQHQAAWLKSMENNNYKNDMSQSPFFTGNVNIHASLESEMNYPKSGKFGGIEEFYQGYQKYPMNNFHECDLQSYQSDPFNSHHYRNTINNYQPIHSGTKQQNFCDPQNVYGLLNYCVLTEDHSNVEMQTTTIPNPNQEHINKVASEMKSKLDKFENLQSLRSPHDTTNSAYTSTNTQAQTKVVEKSDSPLSANYTTNSPQSYTRVVSKSDSPKSVNYTPNNGYTHTKTVSQFDSPVSGKDLFSDHTVLRKISDLKTNSTYQNKSYSNVTNNLRTTLVHPSSGGHQLTQPNRDYNVPSANHHNYTIDDYNISQNGGYNYTHNDYNIPTNDDYNYTQNNYNLSPYDDYNYPYNSYYKSPSEDYAHQKKCNYNNDYGSYYNEMNYTNNMNNFTSPLKSHSKFYKNNTHSHTSPYEEESTMIGSDSHTSLICQNPYYYTNSQAAEYVLNQRNISDLVEHKEGELRKLEQELKKLKKIEKHTLKKSKQATDDHHCQQYTHSEENVYQQVENYNEFVKGIFQVSLGTPLYPYYARRHDIIDLRLEEWHNQHNSKVEWKRLSYCKYTFGEIEVQLAVSNGNLKAKTKQSLFTSIENFVAKNEEKQRVKRNYSY